MAKNDEPPPSSPTTNPPPALRRLPVVFGVLAIGLLALFGGKEWNREQKARTEQEVQAVRAEMAKKALAAEAYAMRMHTLRWRAAQAREWAAAQPGEPLRSWGRDRARLLDAFVAKVSRDAEAEAFKARWLEAERA